MELENTGGSSGNGGRGGRLGGGGVTDSTAMDVTSAGLGAMGGEHTFDFSAADSVKLHIYKVAFARARARGGHCDVRARNRAAQFLCAHTRTHAHVYTRAQTQEHTDTDTQTHKHTHIDTPAHTHTRAHAHAHTRTTHAHTPADESTRPNCNAADTVANTCPPTMRSIPQMHPEGGQPYEQVMDDDAQVTAARQWLLPKQANARTHARTHTHTHTPTYTYPHTC